MIVSGFMGIVFCQNSFIDELFWHSRIYRYDFQRFSRLVGILLRNFSGFMGGTFTISMAQPRILETQVPPPPGDGSYGPRKTNQKKDSNFRLFHYNENT